MILVVGTISPSFRWLNVLSFFNCGFEALLANEVNGISLKQEKLGLKVDVQGAAILDAFGFEALAYWKDVIKLIIMFSAFISFAFIWLQLFVKERR